MVTSFASEPVSGLAVCLLTAASCTSKSAADECAPYVGKCKGSVYSCSPPASTHVTHQRMPLNAKEVICTSIQARETNITFILPLILIQIDFIRLIALKMVATQKLQCRTNCYMVQTNQSNLEALLQKENVLLSKNELQLWCT